MGESTRKEALIMNKRSNMESAIMNERMQNNY
jgi:hypothetical protein